MTHSAVTDLTLTPGRADRGATLTVEDDPAGSGQLRHDGRPVSGHGQPYSRGQQTPSQPGQPDSNSRDGHPADDYPRPHPTHGQPVNHRPPAETHLTGSDRERYGQGQPHMQPPVYRPDRRPDPDPYRGADRYGGQHGQHGKSLLGRLTGAWRSAGPDPDRIDDPQRERSRSAGQDDRLTELTEASRLTEPDPKSVVIIDAITSYGFSAIAIGLAAFGQINFALWAKVDPAMAWTAPFIFEFAMLSFLFRGYRRARKGQSPMIMWVIAMAIGGLSVYTNVVHTSSTGQGLLFGSASAMCLIMGFAKLYDSYRQYLMSKGKVVVPIPKLGRNWWQSPRRAWRAMLIGTAINSDDVTVCLNLAWRWQATYRSLKRSNRIIRRRKDGSPVDRPTMKLAAWNAVYKTVGMPTVVLADVEIPELHVRAPQQPLIAEPQLPELPTQAPVPAVPPAARRSLDTPPHKPRRAITATAPKASTGPTGYGPGDPRDTYRATIAAVQQAITDWKTRPNPVTVDEIAKVCAATGGPSGKGTHLRIRMCIEVMSDRARSVTREAWTKQFSSEYPLVTQN